MMLNKNIELINNRNRKMKIKELKNRNTILVKKLGEEINLYLEQIEFKDFLNIKKRNLLEERIASIIFNNTDLSEQKSLLLALEYIADFESKKFAFNDIYFDLDTSTSKNIVLCVGENKIGISVVKLMNVFQNLLEDKTTMQNI